MRNFFVLLFLASALVATAQTGDVYDKLIKEAESQYYSKQYKLSSETFLKAFSSNSQKAISNDRYEAACSMAQAGMNDAAFFQLEYIATKSNYADYNHLVIDPDLILLHEDTRWSKICARVRQNKEKAEINFDRHLVAMLDTIFIDDQEERMKIEAIVSKYGAQSKEYEAIADITNKKDSINVMKVTKILDKHGWLGADEVGKGGNATLFLVIQHADLKTQEKYLPMMREAVKNKKARAGSLALLEDRVALGEGKYMEARLPAMLRA